MTPTTPKVLPGALVGHSHDREVLDMHTLDRECPRCPGEHGGAGPCDQVIYSARQIRFIMAHRLEYVTMQLALGGSSRVLKERLNDEYRRLPSRHVCTCDASHCGACAVMVVACARCKGQPLHNRPRDCEPCARLRTQDVGVSIGRTSPVHAPMPSAEFLDLLMATEAKRANRWRDNRKVLEFLNGGLVAA